MLRIDLMGNLVVKCWLTSTSIAVVALFLHPTSACAGDRNARAESSADLASARLAWKALKARHTHVAGAGICRDATAGAPTSELPVEFGLNGKWSRVVGDRSEGQNLGNSVLFGGARKYAAAVNSRYGFVLGSRETPPNWVIEGIARTDAEMRKCELGLKLDWYGFVSAPWSIGGVGFDEIFDHPGFAITKLAEFDENERSLVKVFFTLHPTDAELRAQDPLRPLWVLRGGALTFWPQASWSLLEADLENEASPGMQSKTTLKVEYDDHESRVPRLRSVRWLSGHETSQDEQSFEVQKYEFTELPESYFTLSAFGLPDPQFSRAAPASDSWLLALACATALIIAALGVRHSRRVAAKKARSAR